MASEFEIRFAKEEETAKLEALWAYSFHQDSQAFRHWYFKDYYRHKECLVAIGADGDIYASLQLIETNLEKNGRLLNGAYIVGVDVKPEARDEKLAKKLMLYAEAYAKKEGFDFLLLMPFEAGFYTRFGYSFIDYHYLLELSLEELEKTSKEGAFKAIDFNDLPLAILSELYQKSQSTYLIRLKRGERHFKALAKDTEIEGGYAYLYHREGQPAGYIFYTLTDSFNVRELVYSDEEARRAIYHFILSHASQVAHLKWNASILEPLAFDRKIDKTKASLYPFMMAKLINPNAFIAPYLASKLVFNLKKIDETIISYQLDESGLKALANISCEAAFELSEKSLTKLAFGRHQMEVILPSKVKNFNAWQAFLALFEKGSLYFNEYF